MTGFTDRSGLPDASLGDRGNATPPDSGQTVTLVLNLLLDDGRKSAIHVADTTHMGVTCWLPRSQIKVEPVALGRTLRVTMPLWLAREKNLAVAVAAEGEGTLF